MNSKVIDVAFRFDDPSTVSPIELEKQLIETFGKHGFKCAFGVIPNVTTGDYHDPTPRETLPLSEEKIELYKAADKNGIVDIVLHGYEHRSLAVPGQLHSEFCGLSYEKQLKKIKKGKAFLESKLDVKITSFIPPWNTYDENTIKALVESGISYISANRRGADSFDDKISFIPITIELGDLKVAITRARDSDDNDVAVVVLMHPYDFTESGDERGQFSCGDLSKLLEWLKDQPDVTSSAVSEFSTERFNSERYKANYPSKLEKIYLPFISRTVDNPLYHSTAKAKRLKRSRDLVSLLVHSSTFCIAWALAYFLFSLVFETIPQIRIIFLAVLLVALLLIIVRSIRNSGIYFAGFQLVSALSGLLIGIGLI